MFGKLFGKRSNDETVMADAEEQEYRIDGIYLDNQRKRFELEQMQEQQRRADRAEYDAEQRMYADRAKRDEAERKARAAQVRANGGRWIQRDDGTWIDCDGKIVSASFDGALDLSSL